MAHRSRMIQIEYLKWPHATEDGRWSQVFDLAKITYFPRYFPLHFCCFFSITMILRMYPRNSKNCYVLLVAIDMEILHTWIVWKLP